MKTLVVLPLAALLAVGSTVPMLHSPRAFAQGAGQAAAEALAAGEVRKVDRDAGKITIRHGALPALGMPAPMTMVYGVKDPALLDGVKPGDRIRFVAEKIGGQFTVVRIEPAG